MGTSQRSFIWVEAYFKGILVFSNGDWNSMLCASMSCGLFDGIQIFSGDECCLSHLQFANDTLNMWEKCWTNARVIKANILFFELIVGLKVNFHKRSLVSVNVNGSWLEEAVITLDCKLGHLLFKYIGLSIGGNPRRLSFWNLVIGAIRGSLSG